MEVLVGPAFEIDAASYVRTQNETAAHVRDVAQDEVVAAGGDLFLEDGKNKSGEDLSERSSSIGVPADSSEEDEEEEDDAVSSNSVLGSLSSLQDCLPIKRGLSNHYTGRSKSFANLSEASGVKDLEKVENPFNKRRRILMANKWSRTSSSSFYSWRNPKSMPLLSLQEEDEGGNAPDCNDEDDDECRPSSTSFSSSSSSSSSTWSSPMLPQLKLQSRKIVKADLKSQSCFSLRDLEEEHQ